jgi:hypothetical protein
MIEDMDFSTALIHLKNGFNVARKGWNGRDMYLTLKQGYPVNGHIQPQTHDQETPQKNPDGSENIMKHHAGQILSHILLKVSGDSEYWGVGYFDYIPWTPSQMDLLAIDWEIVK